MFRDRIDCGLRPRRGQNVHFPSEFTFHCIFFDPIIYQFYQQAFRNHQLHDPLIEPGSADLTADVDFAALKRAVRHSSNPEEWKALVTFGTVDQASFLNKMGIQVRLDQLVASCGTNEDGVKLLKSAHQMLTDPAGMGGKFKVLSLFPGVMEGFLSRYPPHGFT